MRQSTVRRGRWAVLAAAGALMVAGCSSSGIVKGTSDGDTQSSAPTATASTATSASTDASSAASSSDSSSNAAPSSAKSWASEPAMTIDTTKKYTMTLHTDQGDIVIAMDAAKTPHTVNSMNFLAAQHFYDGSRCHRLSTDPALQMLQCGDPTGTGAGGPGYQFDDENLAGATYKDGTVAMANAGPKTNGSQFFMVFGDSRLPPSYTPFGTITAGHDILTHIASGGISNPTSDGSGPPTIPLQIKSVTVVPS